MRTHEQRQRTSRPDVAARFADLPHARLAIEALENSGFDGDDIVLLGDRAAAASRDRRQTPADSRAVTYLFWKVTVASVLWGLVGVLVGLAVGAIILWISGSWNAAAWLWVFAILGGFLGGTVAAMVGAERSISDSDAWNLTFQDAADGSVWVGVRLVEADRADRALQALEHGDPITVRVEASEP